MLKLYYKIKFILYLNKYLKDSLDVFKFGSTSGKLIERRERKLIIIFNHNTNRFNAWFESQEKGLTIIEKDEDFICLLARVLDNQLIDWEKEFILTPPITLSRYLENNFKIYNTGKVLDEKLFI